MAEYILAHDLGTSGNKATLFTVKGELVASRICPYELYCNEPLWAEQDADDWWRAVCFSTKEIIRDCSVSSEEIKAVSFSGQMLGVLPVDCEGRPLMRAIIWADMRATEQAACLRNKIEDDKFYQIVGQRNTASYGIQKMMWLKEHKPEIYDQTYKFLNAKDYIVYKLTGQFYTDCSDANSTDCFDLREQRWSEEILAASGIDPEKLPQVVESTFLVGTVTEAAAKETGLAMSTKVVMGAGDGVAANVGAGSVRPGSAYCCMGTSAWLASTTEQPVLDPNMRFVCWTHAVPGLYSPNATMQYAGGSFNWLKNTICMEETKRAKEMGCSVYDLMNQEICESPSGSNGVIFLPYLKGERAPRWNEEAKGVFYGLTANTKRSDLLRAVMEGIFMNLALCLQILKEQTPIEEILLIGGSFKSLVWQHAAADIYGIDVRVPVYIEEANSMGAAVIAGVGSGIYDDFNVVDQFIEIQNKVAMDPERHEVYREMLQEYDSLYHALINIFKKK